jgi:threonine dehydrogenase-like Zn-dependent dehydrogenase
MLTGIATACCAGLCWPVRSLHLHTACRYLFLTDILPTAWHGTELSEVGKGDTVAIWGAGPGDQAKHFLYQQLETLVCADLHGVPLSGAVRFCAVDTGLMSALLQWAS